MVCGARPVSDFIGRLIDFLVRAVIAYLFFKYLFDAPEWAAVTLAYIYGSLKSDSSELRDKLKDVVVVLRKTK